MSNSNLISSGIPTSGSTSGSLMAGSLMADSFLTDTITEQMIAGQMLEGSMVDGSMVSGPMVTVTEYLTPRIPGITSRFALVLYVSRRARELATGAVSVFGNSTEKKPITALKEICNHTVDVKNLHEKLIGAVSSSYGPLIRPEYQPKPQPTEQPAFTSKNSDGEKPFSPNGFTDEDNIEVDD